MNIDEEKQGVVKIVDIDGISPHNKALYEAGKAILVDSINIAREFCKFMIGTSIGAIPIYLGLLKYFLPENYSLGKIAGFTIAFPALVFLLASILFTLGYLPGKSEFSLDIVEEIKENRDIILNRLNRFIWIGLFVFILGLVLAIGSIIVNIGVR
jgi:hypothetical protein